MFGRVGTPYSRGMADERRPSNEKPIKLPDDFEQTLKDLLATGPTPKNASELDESESEADG